MRRHCVLNSHAGKAKERRQHVCGHVRQARGRKTIITFIAGNKADEAKGGKGLEAGLPALAICCLIWNP